MNASSHLRSSFVPCSFSFARKTTQLAITAVATLVLGSSLFAQSPLERSVAHDPCASCPPHRPVAVRETPKTPSIDWTTLPSTYTHDATGKRVDQHTAAVEPQSNERPDYVKSGFRYTRSSIQAGFNADHYHTTETWGAPIQPYGQWRYPYRPFSVPYGAWGPQLPQAVVGGVNVWNGMPNGQPGNWPRGGFGPGGPGFGPNMGQPGMGNGNPNQAPIQGAPQAGAQGWNGGAPGWQNGAAGWQGASQGWNNWNNGPVGPGMNYAGNMGYGGSGAFGVGPGNALSPTQDEYYPQAPTYQPLSGGFFNSPVGN